MPINKLKTTSIEIDAVTADLIATGAITVADIADGEITAAKLHTTLDFSTKTFTMHNNHITQAMVTQHQGALSVTESQISDLQSYLTAETNDLSSAVVWANVPNANITQASVTQHQAALSIQESQISDLQSYITTVGQLSTHTNVSSTVPSDQQVLAYNNSANQWEPTTTKAISFTTVQRDALSPTDGDLIYNTTDNKFQGRANGAWVNLH